jgi:hypothetical protein
MGTPYKNQIGTEYTFWENKKLAKSHATDESTNVSNDRNSQSTTRKRTSSTKTKRSRTKPTRKSSMRTTRKIRDDKILEYIQALGGFRWENKNRSIPRNPSRGWW